MSKFTFDPTIYNKSKNKPMSSVLEAEISRRSVLKRTAMVTAFAALAGTGLTACRSDDNTGSSSSGATNSEDPLTLGFESIPGAKLDAIVVPAGYTATVLAPWGTPLNDAADAWKNDGSNTSVDQLNAMGMHHDGMHFFPIGDGVDEGVLCINHEYISTSALHSSAPVTTDNERREKARKEINAHGVSVVHIKLVNDTWDVVAGSNLNRRFTSATEMDIAGPIADSDLDFLVTRYTVEQGNKKIARGTNNNCGNGHTPWGTYLTCEENWPGYFVRTDNRSQWTAEQRRMGISNRGNRYGWHTLPDDSITGEFSRFNITPSGTDANDDFRNEANGHGYIVEIDPYNPASRAVKRTALGRFRHEDCSFGNVEAGKPVVFYSGHDGRFEYIYKFVSKALWNPADADPSDRLATGAKYMNEGTLYVARFSQGGEGSWLALTPESVTEDNRRLGDVDGFGTLAEILLNAPGAADLMGATPMDRPEWTAVDPKNGAVYVTLTNNTRRDDDDSDSDNDTNVANPRANNRFGHIIRWTERSDATTFDWEFFLFGSPANGDAEINLSGLNSTNELASPDGLVFDKRGILWVQTDNGADEVEDNTNDQMLAVIPTQLNQAEGNSPVINEGNQDQLKRFFVGPNDCEVTGLAFNADNTTFFVNIQHPGNWPYSSNAAEATPQGVSVRPRAATVVIRREDGGEIGL
ncbi:PhoX family protein [Endozoicomonas ascidiicola]|uniref:PhoX family protein n=1 Tax=Endozoicomonas ascidiicola TaxID=1698521 RepID=UPI0008360633|nr:PhoX family phosphatase [Endozoicomonas ascidiicola]